MSFIIKKVFLNKWENYIMEHNLKKIDYFLGFKGWFSHIGSLIMFLFILYFKK